MNLAARAAVRFGNFLQARRSRLNKVREEEEAMKDEERERVAGHS